MLQHPLDDEHHVGAARIIFVEHDGNRVAQRPGQDAFVKLGHLLAVAQLDRVLADQVDPADVAVKVDAHAGPVQMGGHLFDMGRFAGAVIALDHHPAVVSKTCKDGERGVGIELVGRVDLGDAVGAFGKAADFHLGVDAKNLANRGFFGGFCDLIQHSVRHSQGRANPGNSTRV